MFRVSSGRRSGLPVVGFGHISHHALVFLLLALRGGVSKCRLGSRWTTRDATRTYPFC